MRQVAEAQSKQQNAVKGGKGGKGGKDKKNQGGNKRQAKGGAAASSKEVLIAKIEAMKIEELPRDYEVDWDFPDVDPLSIPVIQVKEASFGYENGPILFNDVDGGVDLDSKVALIGANGSGKYV